MINDDFSIKKIYTSLVAKNRAGSSAKSQKIHDYSKLTSGQDYVLESAIETSGFYITAQGHNIKPKDYLLLSDGNTKMLYQIVAVEYYSEPSDMWTALILNVEAKS